LYLPRELLDAANVPATPDGALKSPHLPQVCAEIAAMAEQNFARANAAMDLCDATAMRPARLMEASYRPLLSILRKRDFNYTEGRVSLPKWRKLLLAARLLLN
jgi:phytoene synthase